LDFVLGFELFIGLCFALWTFHRTLDFSMDFALDLGALLWTFGLFIGICLGLLDFVLGFGLFIGLCLGLWTFHWILF
jgi:hypothetical protein